METEEEQDTETKLAILSSIFTGASQDSLFDTLIRAEGDIPRAIDLHLDSAPPSKRQKLSTPSPQKSILKWTASAEPPRKVSSPLSMTVIDDRFNIKRYIFTIPIKSLN